MTAGNTQTPIDRVRCITNIFSGRTGARIALTAAERGHTVSLATSHADLVANLKAGRPISEDRLQILAYKTYDDLHALMAQQIGQGGFDVVIHSAAVSDYALGGIYAPAGKTADSEGGFPSGLVGVAAGKVKSSHQELWLRLVPTIKLVDLIRGSWNFQGTLVKFKLEVGATEEELLGLAEPSRRQSRADLMVANTLEGMNAWALVGPIGGNYQKVERALLSERLLDAVESLAK